MPRVAVGGETAASQGLDHRQIGQVDQRKQASPGSGDGCRLGDGQQAGTVSVAPMLRKDPDVDDDAVPVIVFGCQPDESDRSAGGVDSQLPQ